MAEQQNSYKRLWEQVRNYISLTVEDTKLTVAEKFTVFVTAAAISIVALLFGVIILFFVSVALAHLLEPAVGAFWSYLIVAGGYLVILLLLVLLRRPLISNPVARFITRLFFKD